MLLGDDGFKDSLLVRWVVLFLFGCLSLMEVASAATLEDAHRLIVQKKHTDAVLELEKLTRQYPRDYKAQFLLGEEYARSNRLNKAIEAFQIVSGLRPELAEPHANLAAIFNALGEFSAAARELDLYLEKHPDTSVTHENLANLYVKLAVQHYKRSLDKHQNTAVQEKFDRLRQVLRADVARSMQGTGREDAKFIMNDCLKC